MCLYHLLSMFSNDADQDNDEKDKSNDGKMEVTSVENTRLLKFCTLKERTVTFCSDRTIEQLEYVVALQYFHLKHPAQREFDR